MKLDTIPSISVTNKNTETLEYHFTAQNSIALFKRRGTELVKTLALEKHYQNRELQKQCTFHLTNTVMNVLAAQRGGNKTL